MNTDIAREAIQELQEVKKAWEDSVKYAHELELRVQELEKTEGHFNAELNAAKNDYARYKLLKAQNAALLDVVRDCVNFLADFHATAPFDMQFLTVRAKALHKRAYTAHSKAKEK